MFYCHYLTFLLLKTCHSNSILKLRTNTFVYAVLLEVVKCNKISKDVEPCDVKILMEFIGGCFFRCWSSWTSTEMKC